MKAKLDLDAPVAPSICRELRDMQVVKKDPVYRRSDPLGACAEDF